MNATPISDEARDVPPVTTDLVYLTGAILVVLSFSVGVCLASWLLHTWDAEIRRALFWAGQQLTALFWAWASVNF